MCNACINDIGALTTGNFLLRTGSDWNHSLVVRQLAVSGNAFDNTTIMESTTKPGGAVSMGNIKHYRFKGRLQC